jgi:uncharacterized membrane protein YoaK (UPF0700 family)
MSADSTPPSAESPGPPAPAPGVTSLKHPLTRALILLTLSTGLVDAASYLGVGRVFAANMTGNIVLLGFGIAGSGGLPVVAPLVSLGAFLLGAGAGGELSRRLGDQRSRHLRAALGVETGLMLAAAAVAAAVDVRPDAISGDAVIGLLAFGMGARSSTIRKFAVPDLTTTVLTMTLTGLAAESRPFGGSGAGTLRRGTAVIAMLSGAVLGAVLLKTSLTLVLLVAGALAATTLALYGTRVGEGY